ncbi:MAG TPA: serine/threonine-protein kinase [Herpetosiphonaceae bacterium]|nr:serine/threonine-protein kinase [Herpetosiphonaceae bacterium]
MLLGSRYQIQEPIRSGGMATVYAALDLTLERPVAIKRLKRELASDQGCRDQFLHEARVLAALRHPHVVEAFDFDMSEERPYLVMELIDGQTLSTLLPLPAPQALDYLMQVAEALAFCHAHGLLHCDVKPENIMVDRSGRVKLIDFGISLPDGTFASGPLVGSPHYVAPERVSGGPLTAASDVYAFGIVLFQTITGLVPFDGPDAASVARQHVEERVPLMSEVLLSVPLSLERVVSRATAPSPLARYHNGTALLEALYQTREDLLGVPVPEPAARHNDISSATAFWAQGTGPISEAQAA